jgi:hypothetical protein
MMRCWLSYIVVAIIAYFSYTIYKAAVEDDFESDSVGLQPLTEGHDPIVEYACLPHITHLTKKGSIVAIHDLDRH